jgi:hypothetical protein
MKFYAAVCAAIVGFPAFADTLSAPTKPPQLPIRLRLQQNAQDDNLSIYVGINGGPPIPYLFDTGSDAFLAAPPAWLAVKPVPSIIKTKVPEKMIYGDGTYGYTFLPVRAHLAFFDPHMGVPSLVLPNPDGYVVGRIIEQLFDDEPKKHIMYASKATTDTGVFGARMMIGGGGAEGDAPDTYNISNTLAQIPGVQGYVVTDNGLPGTASVTVGLNQAIRDQFPQKITLNPRDDTFPSSNLHSYDEAVVNLTFSREGRIPVTIQIILGLDTGSSKGYHLVLTPADAKAVAPYLSDSNAVDRDKATKVRKAVKPGTLITFAFPSRKDGFNYSFRSTRSAVRSNSGEMVVTDETASYSDVTAGIGFFEHFAVMYDLEKGELGFRVTPPDLSPRILHPEENAKTGATPFLTWPTVFGE